MLFLNPPSKLLTSIPRDAHISTRHGDFFSRKNLIKPNFKCVYNCTKTPGFLAFFKLMNNYHYDSNPSNFIIASIC